MVVTATGITLFYLKQDNIELKYYFRLFIVCFVIFYVI